MRKVHLLKRVAPVALAAGMLFAGCGLGIARAAEDGSGCARVHKALENVVTTPAHAYTKETSTKRGTTESETIYLDGKVYVLTNGRWTLSPVSAVQMVETQRQSRKHATLSCKLVGEQTLEDRPVVVYTSSRRTSDSRVESKLWIDKASGLLLKQEEDMTASDENTVHRAVRYEYGNVTAPKVPD